MIEKTPAQLIQERKNEANDKNHKKIITGYIKLLFTRYKTLKPMRVNFHACSNDDLLATFYKDRLFYLMKKDKRFENIVGYMWKLDHGSGGFSYECIFFVHNEDRNPNVLAFELTNLWSRKVTEIQGSATFNPFDDQSAVHHLDAQLVEWLIFNYSKTVTRPNGYRGAAGAKNIKTLGKKQLPPLKN